jgi:hypothetical protein
VRPVFLRVPGQEHPAAQWPTLELRRGACLELRLADEALRPVLVRALGAAAHGQSVRLGVARNPGEVDVTGWDRLWGRATFAHVAARLTGSRDVALRACIACGLDPAGAWLRTAWTGRTLLCVECAAHEADVLVASDGGLDPMGMRRLAAHLEALAVRAGVAVAWVRSPVAGGPLVADHVRIG